GAAPRSVRRASGARWRLPWRVDAVIRLVGTGRGAQLSDPERWRCSRWPRTMPSLRTEPRRARAVPSFGWRVRRDRRLRTDGDEGGGEPHGAEGPAAEDVGEPVGA